MICRAVRFATDNLESEVDPDFDRADTSTTMNGPSSRLSTWMSRSATSSGADAWLGS
jgi:hypothetical protein